MADLAVVGGVAVGHDEAVIANADGGVFLTGGVDGYKFPNVAVFPDFNVGGLSVIFPVLRFGPDAGGGVDGCPLSDGGVTVDIGMGLDDDIIFKSDMLFDDRIGLDGDVFPNLGPFFDDCTRMD